VEVKPSREVESVHSTSLLSGVAIAAAVAVAAICLLLGIGTSKTNLPGADRTALVVIVMVLGFSGVLMSTLLNLPDQIRRALVALFATALICSGFVALVWWFAVSGASNSWL
jgi:CHASE2 domain-containing sensor protein